MKNKVIKNPRTPETSLALPKTGRRHLAEAPRIERLGKVEEVTEAGGALPLDGVGSTTI